MAQLMDVTRSLTFNLGKYEKMTFSVTLKDIPVDTDAKAISETLDEKMEADIERAAFATVHHPDDNVTSIFAWNTITKEGMDA